MNILMEKKNGNCKFLNENLSLEFEGEYLDDKRYGEGKTMI